MHLAASPPAPSAPLLRRVSRQRGAWMVWAASAAFGVSGTASQRLFAQGAVTPDWLVTIRMLTAGLCLLAWAALTHEDPWAPFRTARDRSTVLVFGVLGLYAVQVTYMQAIAHASAPVATILQALGVVWLAAFLALRTGRWPGPTRLAAMCLALLGTALMVTGGHLGDGSLAVGGAGLAWGLLSGLAMAFYTVYAQDLMARAGRTTVTGWGMLVGGLCAALVRAPWSVSASHLTLGTLSLVAFVCLIGTALAFRLYLGSLAHLAAQDTALLSTGEPISAAVTSRLWLGTPLPLQTVAGGLAILAGVVSLSRVPHTSPRSPGHDRDALAGAASASVGSAAEVSAEKVARDHADPG